MELLLQRYSMVMANGGSTQGILIEKTLDGFVSHTIEDEQRDIKVAGETRIPAGFYELRIWNEGQNPNDWVLKHREKYGDWFDFPIEVIKVPGFSGVLIHVGFGEKDTDGCILLDDTIGNNTVDAGQIGGRSMDAVKRFYLKFYPLLKAGTKVFIEVRDEKNLIN